jgi:integrase
MVRPNLSLVEVPHSNRRSIPFDEKLTDHNAIIDKYGNTFLTRNLCERTMKFQLRYIKGWFEGIRIKDQTHPEGERQLLLWEAMEPICGHERIANFSNGLYLLGLSSSTRYNYLGILRRFFDYVLEWPYIPGESRHIASKYGPLEQPVLSYDYPVHVIDHEDEGFALTGDALLDFYNFVRTEHIKGCQKKLTASRDYTMIVLAGESGLRANELRNLDAFGAHNDLFYERNLIQTRFGKGFKGSGKRTRKTIFTDLAQITTHTFEERIRPQFPNATTNPALFLAETGVRIAYSSMERSLRCIVSAARETGMDLPPNMSWHSLRRSFATNYIERYPQHLWTLLQMLGHINPGSINHYVKFRKNHLEKTINTVLKKLLP